MAESFTLQSFVNPPLITLQYLKMNLVVSSGFFPYYSAINLTTSPTKASGGPCHYCELAPEESGLHKHRHQAVKQNGQAPFRTITHQQCGLQLTQLLCISISRTVKLASEKPLFWQKFRNNWEAASNQN